MDLDDRKRMASITISDGIGPNSLENTLTLAGSGTSLTSNSKS